MQKITAHFIANNLRFFSSTIMCWKIRVSIQQRDKLVEFDVSVGIFYFKKTSPLFKSIQKLGDTICQTIIFK